MNYRPPASHQPPDPCSKPHIRTPQALAITVSILLCLSALDAGRDPAPSFICLLIAALGPWKKGKRGDGK